MNELNKNNIAQETHAKAIGYYKQSEQFGYKFLMELKKIRDDRLFTELGFKDFDQYTQQSFNYTRRTIDKRISAAETFGNDFENARSQLGDRKVQQIAQLPYDQREEVMQDGIDTEQGHKSVDEATTREIEEYKRKLKQSEEANKTLDGILSENAETISALEQQVKNKPKPEVVEKEVEVEKVPDDYDYIKGAFENIKGTNEMYKEQNEELRRELKSYSNQPNVDNSELLAKKEKLEAEISTLENVSGLGEEINDFINRVSSYEYQIDMRKLASKRDVLKSIHEAIDGLKKWCSDFENELPTQNFIEGEINHE